MNRPRLRGFYRVSSRGRWHKPVRRGDVGVIFTRCGRALVEPLHRRTLAPKDRVCEVCQP